MKFRILLVDTDQYLLDAHKRYFVRAGYEVECAVSDADAMTMLMRKQYAAIVCDLHLDDNDSDQQGLVFASQVRALRPGVAFIIMTSRVSVEFERNALSRGVFMCLTKPQPLQAIQEAIEFAIIPDPLGSKHQHPQKSGQAPVMYFGGPHPLNRSSAIQRAV